MNKQLIFQPPAAKFFLTNLIFRNLSNILITILMMLGAKSILTQLIPRIASARQKETPAPIGTDASVFKDSLLIFCDVPEKKFDKILFKLRQSKISVDYKAILTPTNSKWTVKRLMLELGREHAAFISMHKG